MSKGYIYVRTNEYWDIYDAFKLGKTLNIPDREQTYVTSEIKRGTYVMIIEIDILILDNVEQQLQVYFNGMNLHVKFDAGFEFYKKVLINFIIPYLDTKNIEYKILSQDETGRLIRKMRICKDTCDDKILEYIDESIKNTEIYNPRDYQITIINNSSEYFQHSGKGLLIIPCGVGKTLISLWITQKLNSNTIIIGVPNKLLLKQWEEIICVLWHNMPYLIVSGGMDIEAIMIFLKNNQNRCIVITTYSSAYKVYIAAHHILFVFSMKILDEVHHLTTNNMNLAHTTKKYIQMLNIPSFRQLSLTATLKQLETSICDDAAVVVSNDNAEYFGEIIDRKCVLWAINENIICDYVIQTIITNEEQMDKQLVRFRIITENDTRLFLSAFASLKSICTGNSHHVLIYVNNTANSLKIVRHIKMLLNDNYFDMPDLYYSHYHGDMKTKDQKQILGNFETARQGIITCVYCLSEGYDNHNIDAVVFAENMTSNIRIVQSSLRASRKNKRQPDKITKIILPILNKDDWLANNNNPDLKKVREVIYQMGLEDETIAQKIKVYNIEVTKHKNRTDSLNNTCINDTDNFGDYEEELTAQLKLKTIKRITLGISYEKARKIIASKNIKNKDEYVELCKKYNILSVVPELVYNGQFTNWIDYLSIERIYYDLDTCIKKVSELLRLHPAIKQYYLELAIVCKELCKLDTNLPPHDLWVEYYNVKDLRDIIIITNKKKRASGLV